LDKDGNIINDTNDPDKEKHESGPFNKNIEITGVDENDSEMDKPTQTGHITGNR